MQLGFFDKKFLIHIGISTEEKTYCFTVQVGTRDLHILYAKLNSTGLVVSINIIVNWMLSTS